MFLRDLLCRRPTRKQTGNGDCGLQNRIIARRRGAHHHC
jgi:hypothetical protein